MTWRVLLVILFISGLLLYAYAVDHTVYKTEHLLVIPSFVEADESWQGTESVLIQDLSGDALYQNFSKTNSAYLVMTKPAPTSTNSTIDSDNASTGSESVTITPSESTDNTSADEVPLETTNSSEQSEAATNGVDTSTDTQTVEPVQDSAEPTSFNSINVEPFVFTNVRYPLAQVDETVSTDPVVLDSTNNNSAEVPAVAIPVVDDTSTENTPVVDKLEEVIASTTDALPADEVSTATVREVKNDELFGISSCSDIAGCQSHSLTFTGFTLPDFESGTMFDSVQLRLSLAAKAKSSSEVQRYTIAYTLDNGSTWNAGSVIDIDGEAANSINGDHYLVSLDIPAYAVDLSGLKVRVTYEGVAEDLDGAYVDAVWLDVTSGKFYEEGAGEESKDTLDYNRNLLSPALNTLDNNEIDPALGHLPSFTLSYDPQTNFLSRAFRSLFSENSFSVNNITVTDAEGTMLSVPVSVTYHDDMTWTLDIEKQPQALRPGKYKVTASMIENGEVREDSFEFYWGVLAVNTKKSMYAPNEGVVLNLAALKADGTTICDADLHLQITDPKNNFFDVPVEQSESCGHNNVTDKPDYIAKFTNTGEWGKYTIVLENRNEAGEVVHKIQDSFEVRDYIPYDIERSAPTRIYPPAPYKVDIKVSANRDFEGDITERVPRGFIVTDLTNATITTLPEYTLITWKQVTMKVGDKKTFSYTFDAPDISPYMYLLGPLDMDGFSELRQWQIASDALNNIGWFTGTRTVAGTNLNNTPSPLQWSTSSVDNYYYTHSTSTDSERVVLRQPGDYLVAVTLPQTRTDALANFSRAGIEVRVNGVAVPEGLGRSGYISNANAHNESSSHVSFMLSGIKANDYIEVVTENLVTIVGGVNLNVMGQASMYVEYMGSTESVFAATTTQTTSSTSLNQATAFPMKWTETRQDTDYLHSDTVSPESITIVNPGTYMVHVNIPLTGMFNNTVQQNIIGRVLLNGVAVPGGTFEQGMQQSTTTQGDADASIHWSGVVVATTSNQVLTITAQQEAGAGTVVVTPAFAGSIFMQKMATTSLIALYGRTLGTTSTSSNWNPTATTTAKFSSRLQYDSTVFTHSTTTNVQQIVTVNQSGDYLLTWNNAATGTVTNANARVTVQVNGVSVPGAVTASNYVRNQNAHTQTSGSLVYLLTGLSAGATVTVSTIQEGAAGTLGAIDDSVLMLIKKANLDFRAPAPSMFNVPFDNARSASTTPYFDFQSNDPDGTSKIQYQFQISTTTDFIASTTRTSGTDTGFSNTASSTEVSPYTEANKIRFQLQTADQFSDLTTYYWRVRAKDVTGSGQFGDWSTTQSYNVNAGNAVPDWHQTLSGQFQTDTLIGAVSNGSNDNIKVDSSVNSEILMAYGNDTSVTPKYRLWGGTSWGAEQSAQAVNGTVNWVRTAAGVSRDEYVLATIDTSSASYAQIYQASTSGWGNKILMASNVADATKRGIAVAYESLSGRAMVVSCANNASPVYRIWDGASWSATSTIAVTSAANCNFLEIAADPTSNEMILVVRDGTGGNAYEAIIWDGTAWGTGNRRQIGSSVAGQLGRFGASISYESSGDQAVVAVTNGNTNGFIYTVWNGTVWSTNAAQTATNDVEWSKMVSDPNSDKMLLCYIDDSQRIGAYLWDGAVWSTFTNIVNTAIGNSQAGRPVDCEFETTAGRSGTPIVAYSDTVVARYSTYNYASSTWLASSTITGLGSNSGLFWMQSERAEDGTIVVVAHDDVATGDEIESTYWNGTAWATKQAIVANPSSTSTAPYETFEMAAKRFVFTQGVVRSTPISFTYVAGQITWGDLSFGTTEPLGTDVKLRLRYTSTTTCDSYVPDIALVGNTAGFDVSATPIVLTGLSTTTYNQLCLEATLTSLGSASASLDEWTLAWLRKPKLVQQNFRWYTNVSALTVSDPWPLGANDVAENFPLASDQAVSVNQAIRLRMSLQGANVTLPTSTSAFKLQYAQGNSCSQITSWSDVGDVASTTALWRGFNNSIVGSDWFSGSWQRRLKLTIPSTLVSGTTTTNFPVYVNLADLPATFFSNVRTDGGDIRITKADGLSEVPVELVSIDTSSKTGELHFKGDLSTTTNTAFYLYYKNATATSPAVTATYGRNNVWSNGFAAVYHFDQDPGASAPQYIDSTGNSNGTSVALISGDRKSGMIGRYLAVDGVSKYVNLGSTLNTTLLRSTWQIWASSTVNQDAYDGMVMNRATGETSGINVSPITGRLGYHWKDAAATYSWQTGPTFPTSSAPFMATLVIEPTIATMWRHAAIGVASSTNATTHATATLSAVTLGGDACCGGRFWNGGIDEVTISNVVRSSGWIQTTYNNRSNPTGFYTIASEEKVNDGLALPGTLLTGSDYTETYEETNPTNLNSKAIPVGDASEWDFVIQNNNALVNTNYCFRMIYADNSVLNTYTNFPRLVTNSAPLTPTLSAPFDNKQTASTTPKFEFAAIDELSDLVSYEIVVDDNADFSSPVYTRDSNSTFSLFENLSSPSERSLYTSGQTVRFSSNVALSNGVTYWWRVRAKDDTGSNAYSDWSTAQSFTVNTGTTITTWFQTTGDQFATDALSDTIFSTSTADIGLASGMTVGTSTTNAADFDNHEVGNAWGAISFTQNVTSGSIRHYVEYALPGNQWILVPDTDLPGNSSGFTASPIAVASLDTTLYNQLRVVSVFSGNATLPRLQDITITWSQKIEPPTLITPFDNAKTATTAPNFTFTTADPQGDDLQYEIQLSQNYDFNASSTYLSGVNAGFTNVTSATDTSPYTSGHTIQFASQSSLSNGLTYWWRARARDPNSSNSWSNYSIPKSFTVDTASTIATWHQTTGEQFTTDALVNLATTTGGAQVTSVVNGVMVAYGEGTGQAPRYQLWNGSTWGAAASADSVNSLVMWTRLKAATTRPEFALGTLGTDLDTYIQIYNSQIDSWGDSYVIDNNAGNSRKRSYDLAYETVSGDLLAVSCVGNNAVYSIWNGLSWSATTSIPLANGGGCEWVTMASDPTSDEIIAAFRHLNTASTTDYQALVWNGSSWGNTRVMGNITASDAYEGMALEYEESGNQALFIAPNSGTANYFWSAWNGSTWTTATTTPVAANFTWGSLKHDVGTDRLAFCSIDNNADIGVKIWDGSSWGTQSIMTINGNSAAGQPVDCEFETVKGIDGDLVVPYSDGTAARYQVFSTASGTFSGELNLDTINNSWRFQTVRGGDGTIHMAAYDDGSNPDRYDTSRFDGSTWTTKGTFTTNPSITASGLGQPFDGSVAIAAQTFPDFTEGSIRSTSINFSDGGSPRWERVRFNDTTPGLSDIRYRVYYESSATTYTLIPDSALPGNATGFTNSPIDISGLDRTVYAKIQLDADFQCDSGVCPSVQDWSVEWSEGITVSGSYLDYDQATPIASGTIAVAVNGVLQVGKTATIASGTTTQQVVFSTAGSSTFTVPTGVTNVTVKAWGAGGGAGSGGTSDAGGNGGAGGFAKATVSTIPAENLTVYVGGAGQGGARAITSGAGGGGGYSGLTRGGTPLVVAGAGAGGGAGSGGISFVSAGTACAVTAPTNCIPTIPTAVATSDVLIAVVHSRTNTTHQCLTNCTGWTEISSQTGTSTTGRLSVWYYRMASSSAVAPTFSGPATLAFAGRIWAFRGVVNSGVPYDVLGANATVTASTTFIGQSVTTSVADAMVLHVGGAAAGTTWSTASGATDLPTTASTTLYANGTGQNSIFISFKNNPLLSAGAVGSSSIVQSAATIGRDFVFALKPQGTPNQGAGTGGVGGGLTGGTGGASGTTTPGSGGTQSAGGAIGGGNATVGQSYTGGDGSSGTGGGAGGAGGVNGGGAGGAGNSATLSAGGGAGGAGYFGGGGAANGGSSRYQSAAGGGGGSSFIVNTATATSTISGTSTLVGNATDTDYVAPAGQGGLGATSTAGTGGNAGRVVISWTTTAAAGAWSIPNVAAFPGDVVTVFVQNATGTDEAVAVTKYDGIGDITGMQLSKRHLTIGSNDVPTVKNADLALYTNSSNEDIFFSNSGSTINLCAETSCTDARLRILAGSTYQPGANTSVINFMNSGVFTPATSTLRVSNVWNDLGIFNPGQSTIIFTATTSSYVPANATSTFEFYNLTLGETTGNASWNFGKPLSILGSLAIDRGTLARATSTITVQNNLSVGGGGVVTGLGTTTFAGSGSSLWSDASATGTNIGYVVIDGTAKTVTLGSNVTAQSVTIGADDALNASGSGFNLSVLTTWVNNNTFIPQSGTVTFVGTSSYAINNGSSNFNNLTFSGIGGNWSFSTTSITLTGDLTIATGTVTLPTGTTSIAGSFVNNGGNFAHNNGEVRFTGSASGKTIKTLGTTFLNAFYDLVISGTGGWTFSGSATTSRNLRINAGTLTAPTSTLTVAGDFLTSGSGTFNHNNGQLILLVQGNNSITTNGSPLNNVRVSAGAGSWYSGNWSGRVALTALASKVGEAVTNFPVYVNLANLPASFFSGVSSTGADIRVTTGDGMTEVPFELVAIDTAAKTGELHFKAPNLSTTTDNRFYIYYGNSAATAYATSSTYGRNNVWTNGYLAVYHLNESPTAAAPQYVSSVGTSTGTSNNMEVGDVQAAAVGNGQILDTAGNEFIQTTFTGTVTTSTWSVWARADGTQSAYDGLIFSRGTTETSGLDLNSTGGGIGYHWNNLGATAWGHVGPTIPLNSWFMAAMVVVPTQASFYRFATSGLATTTNVAAHTATVLDDLKFGQDDGGGRFFAGGLDEVRLANVARSQGWLQTEYNNQASTTDFYTVSASEARFSRIFAEATMAIVGDFLSDVGGDTTFPSGVMSVAGSYDNNALMSANGGTVRFTAPTGSKTVAAGSSTFATLEINASGTVTVTENATATTAVLLNNASQFTVSSGVTLASAGSFMNAMQNASTTWTGATLRLVGADGVLNTKSNGGDSYTTIALDNDTDMAMWNSTAVSVVTASTSSLYSQDNAAIDGALVIYGNYVRSTGTEFWANNVDFDGVVLTGGAVRAPQIRMATSAIIGFVNASLTITGSSTATATIAALGGTFGLSATNTTISANYFSVANTNVAGFGLYASSTLTAFNDGFFTVATGTTGVSIDGATVNTNPAKLLNRIGFATTTAGSATNVTLVGTSTNYVWFTLGTGNLYGEAFDANDANPGAIRFDDSSYLITVSGRILDNTGTAALGAPTCDGVTQNVRLVVNTASSTYDTSCNATTGAYSISNVAYTGDPRLTVFLNTNGGVQGTTVTRTPSANITNFDVYANQITIRHEGATPMSIVDLTRYTISNDSDVRFSASTSALTTFGPTGLLIAASSTFTPNGQVTLGGTGSTTASEGTLTLATSSQFIAQGTETHTLAGRLVVGSNATVTAASSTFVFNATSTGKSITSASQLTLNNISFTGVAGAWNITAPLMLTGTMTVAAGTVTGTSDITLLTNSITGNGTLSLGAGTTTLMRGGVLGGSTPWTFANLLLGSGLVAGTTTLASAATTTVSSRLTINTAHILDAQTTRIDLSGAGTVFVQNGTFIPGTSLVRYSGNNASVLSGNYYDLLVGAVTGSSTFTGLATGITVANNLTIGNGSASSTFLTLTNDPVVTVAGSLSILASSTFSASDVATTTISGNYTNNGRFVANNGRVLFNTSGASTIIAGASSFDNVSIAGSGTFTIASSATTTQSLVLLNHSSFTVATGSTLAVAGVFTNSLGGAATNWSGALTLFGGTAMTINASTTSDVYSTLSIAANTRVRMWNSSASVYNTVGGLYSQDHAGVDGSLNIYGIWNETTANDYWSYNTDFDGTNLPSGRVVTVSFASGTVASWTGGSLTAIGTNTASTTLQNQGTGTYSLMFGGTTNVNFDNVVIRNVNASGVVFAGAPTVTNFSRTNHLIQINGGTGITLGGTVIDANPAKNFTSNVFASSSGVIGATNVTATGTTISSWRFTNHTGSLSGEDFDNDPTGNPGYLVWDNSLAQITISGRVYSDEVGTVSNVCNGVTQNILLRVAGLSTYTTSCNASTGAYSISGVPYSPNDTLTVYIDNNAKKAVTVSADPISSISNMDLFENRVVVRHEGANPLTIAKMAVWDSSDDGDILFTATDAVNDTLVLPADQKLLIWSGKTFEPNGNITLSGGGGGGAQDGTLEAQTNATFRALGAESHTIGGSMIFGTGATFTAGQSTTTLTSNASGRTIDVNGASFYNLTVTGSGTFTLTDATVTTAKSFTQSAGTVTFGSGTTTIGSSLVVTGGTMNMPGTFLDLTSTSSGNSVRFNGATVPSIRFSGNSGVWTMNDVNATTTGNFSITGTGNVTLPTGNLAVGGSFDNASGTVTHNTADLIMTATGTVTVRANGSDLYALRKIGSGALTMLDGSITLREDMQVASGTLIAPTSTLAIGGSFLVASGTFTAGTGTVLFNATSTGKTINLGTNTLYNALFGSSAGGWTWLGDATTTNNLTLSTAAAFTKSSGTKLTVGGVFTNLVGGGATTWTNTTLAMTGTSSYTINTKTAGGDDYATLTITSADMRAWNSSVATTTLGTAASFYSQDHAGIDGSLYIYGDFTIATSSEYWSYATDFDGTSLTGVERAVAVRLAQNATTTMTSGNLSVLGALGATTTVARQPSATGTFAFIISGGTLNAQYYSLSHLSAAGLQLTNSPTLTTLSNGYFDLAVNGGTLVTVAGSVVDSNASKIFTNIGFNATSGISGNNITLTGSTSNAWRFTTGYGSLNGEAFDVDGVDSCGAIRFDNSACLLTSEIAYRWRNDDGGEGAPDSEWFDQSWNYRQRVRVKNLSATSFSTTSVKVALTYDSNMQTNFNDLRFTLADGVTPTSYWIEKYTASTDAVVWVKVPAVPASGEVTVFAYFGNATATSESSATSTMSAVDDFEDGNISEYSGDTSLFQVDTTPVYGGSRALEASAKTGRTTDGIYRTAMTVSQGQVLRWMQYVDTSAGPSDESCTLFGVQSPGTAHQNYAACLELLGTQRLSLAKNVVSDDVSGTVLSSSTHTYVTGWYQVEVDWQTNNRIDVYLYNPSGAIVASTTAVDSSYTTGGVGFTFWFQSGSWDSLTARGRGPINPTVFLGAKQGKSGASWNGSLNNPGNGNSGDVRRLRVGIENTGLTVTGQNYRLQYAPKGVAASCEALPNGSFAAVPNQASCGTSPVCMQSSANITDTNPTTDLLTGLSGTFSAGQTIESPSNSASGMSLTQYYYTEIEYVLTPTVNASDSYCFRVVNGSTPLDYYAKVAELSLRFDPTFGPLSLNGGQPIVLTPNATTTVHASGTITDFNGYSDLTFATATIYRSGAGASCVANNNNCYIGNTTNRCSFIDCSGSTCTLDCVADIYFHADPTDVGTYAGEEWIAYAEVSDTVGGYDFASAPGIELYTLRALAVDSLINYGALAVNADTGTYNPTTTLANIGNVPFSIEIQGSDLKDAGTSVIPASTQKVATSSFTYASCVGCSLLSSSSVTTLGINLSKPATSTPSTTELYWGIAIPTGTNSSAHQGINVFTPVSP